MKNLQILEIYQEDRNGEPRYNRQYFSHPAIERIPPVLWIPVP